MLQCLIFDPYCVPLCFFFNAVMLPRMIDLTFEPVIVEIKTEVASFKRSWSDFLNEGEYVIIKNISTRISVLENAPCYSILGCQTKVINQLVDNSRKSTMNVSLLNEIKPLDFEMSTPQISENYECFLNEKYSILPKCTIDYCNISCVNRCRQPKNKKQNILMSIYPQTDTTPRFFDVMSCSKQLNSSKISGLWCICIWVSQRLTISRSKSSQNLLIHVNFYCNLRSSDHTESNMQHKCDRL